MKLSCLTNLHWTPSIVESVDVGDCNNNLEFLYTKKSVANLWMYPTKLTWILRKMSSGCVWKAILFSLKKKVSDIQETFLIVCNSGDLKGQLPYSKSY